MKHWRSILVLILVFLAGMAVGGFSVRTVVRREVQQAQWQRVLVRRLRLDDNQQKQLHEILSGSHKQLEQIRHIFQPRIADVLQSTDNQIAALLTPEQLKHYERFKEQYHPFWYPLQRPPAGAPSAPPENLGSTNN